MTLLPGRRAERTDDAAETVASRLRALDRVVELGEGRLDDALLAPARELSRRAGERLRLSGTHTVVALAGATGSGKSSLFNALAGAQVSPVGRAPADHRRRARGGVGRRTARARCSTGSRSPAGTPWSRRTTCAGWCCSTCPTTTRPRWRTGWRSTGWSSWSTCWCGCSTRRSTPTPRSTTATCGRSPGTAT